MSNEEYSVELRQEIRNFLVRDFGWKVLLMGDYFDIFANHYRAVVAIVQYHKENKMGIAVIRSEEFCFVSELMYFSDIHEFRKLIIDYL